MDINLTTTYPVAAKDLEAGMVLCLAGDIPAEIESIKKTHSIYVEVVFVEKQRLGKSKIYFRHMKVVRELMINRYHEN